MTSKKLYSLQFKTTSNFHDNLNKLIELIDSCDNNSIILAPEVSLTNFYYDDMNKAALFTIQAIEILKPLSQTKTVALTMIEKIDNAYYNTLFVFHNNSIIYKQSKVKLFPLGDELKYFKNGSEKSIDIFKIDGIKIGVLICFEIRFTKLWQKLEGADIILIPAMWGKARKKQFEILTNALAVANQCYVIASNSQNSDMASSSAIISPFGKSILHDNLNIIESSFSFTQINKMRKYINIGLS